ncbi:phage tail tape measure protein [Aneurinibacillus danicus]|uniref:Phage tail tape measure protein domain-containing protein n=1 Tax=Aneurinibacillus danicus TaxID=267746 RepID=A0A511V516_9BACL|nr:phage tail tape measure protein [Aneurinibacillus danicus]GEN33859.1 hypothetical protein ADA01nite_13190 [Aneurinibacillus danicus]
MGSLSSLFKLSVIMSMVDRVTPEAMKAGRSMTELQDNMGRLERSSGAFLKRAGMWAGAAVTAITVAIGSIGGAAASMANEVEQATGRLQAQTGITRQAAEEMMNTVKDIYASGRGDSIAGISEDLAVVRQNLSNLSKEAAGDFLSGSYVIRDAFNAEITETSKVVRTLTANFKDLSASDALDLITVGFQRGGNYADDLLDTVNEYAVHFAGLGMSAEQMFATLIAGSKEGAFNLDKVGDSVKEAFIRMQDLSQTSLDAFKALGMNGQEMAAKIAAGGESANQAFQATLLALGNMDDALKRNQIGVALFGTQWEDMEDRVILAMREGQKGLGDFRGATERAGEALYDNVSNKFSRLWRSITVELANAGGPLAGILSEILDRALAMVPQVSAAIQMASKVVASVLSSIMSAGKSIGDFLKPIAPFIGGTISAFAIFAVVMGTAKAAVLGFNIVMQTMRVLMLTNPIGWVLILIGLLIGAFVKLNGGIEGTKKVLLGWFDALKSWWQSDGTQAWVSRAVAALRQFADQAMQAFGWIRQQALTYWPVIRDAIVEAFAYVQTNVLPVVMNIFRDVSGMMARIWEVARPILTQLLATGVKAFRDIWAAVQPLAVTLGRLFQKVFPVVLAAVAAIYRAVTTFLPPVLAFVGEIFLAIYQAVVPIITNVVTSVVQAFNAVLTWAMAIWPYVQQIIARVFQYIQFVWAWVGPFVMAALEILKSIIINGFNFIAATVQFIWNTIKSIIQIAWAVISGIIKTALAIFTGDWQGAWEGVKGILEGVWEGIKTFIGGFGSWLFESGKAIINTLVDGIKSVATAPVEAVKNIFGKVRELLPFSDAKTGPLSDLTYSGSKIPGTIAEGVDKGAGQLRAAAYRMMDGLELERTYPVRFMAETVPIDIQEPDVTANFTQTLKAQFADLPSLIISGFRRGAEWLQAAAGSLVFGIQPVPVPAFPGGGGAPGGFPPPPFPGFPDPDDAPFPAAPSPGMRPSRVDVKEVFRESTTVRETIREKNGQRGPTIELHYHGGSERERRSFFDDLKRFIEQYRE